MFSPQGASNGVVSPMTMGARTPFVGIGMRTPSQLRGAKTPSPSVLMEREREREEYFGDLSVQPLSVGRGKWGELMAKSRSKKKRIPSEVLLNGSQQY